MHQLEVYEKLQAAHEAEQKQRESRSIAPSESPCVDLTLYLRDGLDSEVKLVRFMLATARDKKLKEVLKHIVVEKTDEAFYAHEEYKTLQSLVDRLASATIDVASENYSAARYNSSSKNYLSFDKLESDNYQASKAAFLKEYTIYTVPEDEEESPEAVEPVAESTPAPTSEPEPEIMKGLSKIQRTIVQDMIDAELDEDEITFRMDWLFRPDNYTQRSDPNYFEGLTAIEKRLLDGMRYAGAKLERRKTMANHFRNDPPYVRSGFATEEEYNASLTSVDNQPEVPASDQPTPAEQ